VLAQLVSIGARPAAAALAEARRAQRWATRGIGELVSAGALDALDALLASRVLDEAAARVVESPALERLLARVLESRLLGDAVAGLLEREELWELVETIARSPAVTEAIAHQGVGFADQVAGEVRERSEQADARLERAARRLLRRRGQSRSPPMEPGPA
jgi:hypothetical protein